MYLLQVSKLWGLVGWKVDCAKGRCSMDPNFYSRWFTLLSSHVSTACFCPVHLRLGLGRGFVCGGLGGRGGDLWGLCLTFRCLLVAFTLV
jgi:hypothetical protein